MDIVKLLKCEKKLDEFEKRYETENDSDSTSSYTGVDDPVKKDNNQTWERKPKRRWFQFFKSNPESDDSLWSDELTNHRNKTLALASANHFAKFLDNRSDVLNEINNRTIKNQKNIDVENTTGDPESPSNDSTYRAGNIEAQKIWQMKILPKFSPDERDLIAESLFSHIWNTQGGLVALELMKRYGSTSLYNVSEQHFDRGCQLWSDENTEGAHSEFEQSRRIREVQAAQKSLLFVRYTQYGNQESNNMDTIGTESNAELFFALGMVQMARTNNHSSLREFRRAMQISALGLGMDHELTKASSYMIRSTYASMGHSAEEINRKILQLADDLQHEIEGDQLYESGMKEQALVEYANLKLLYDSDSMVQARIITKMSTIFEEKGDYSKAMDLWTDLLVLYEDTPSIGLHHPLARHCLSKVVKARRNLQPWSEI